MGYSKKRIGKEGKPRYTACYVDLRGQLRSAGTFSSKKESDKAWQKAEVKTSEGRVGDPARGRQRFRRYVKEVWLPNHVMEASTREGYTYQIDRHIMPWFGAMRMVEILPSDVREWVTHLSELKNDKDEPTVSPTTVRNLKEHPERDLHHRAQRPGHLPPPVQGGEDPACAGQAADDHQP